MKADPKAEAAPAPGSSKKMIIMIAAAVLTLSAGGGAAAWFFTKDDGGATPAKKEHKAAKAEKPEYVPVEPFTVNLQPETGEQYLQVQFTLQVPGPANAEVIKENMAQVRSRVLLLLSGKKASEINTVDGKRQLAGEILNTIKAPFVEKGEPQEVSDVLFTSFIIQ